MSNSFRHQFPLVWLAAIAVVLVASFAALTPLAHAHRRATRTESKRMWRAVNHRYGYKSHSCIEHRGQISTAKTPGVRFGIVTIADNHCGNGQFVLSKRGHGRWRVLGAGSDWGYTDRCADDLRKIPRVVLEDFFGAGVCAGYRVGR
jgi:hypothetical protein